MPDDAAVGCAVGEACGCDADRELDVDADGDAAGFAAAVCPKIASLMAEKMLMCVSSSEGRVTHFYARTIDGDRIIRCQRGPSERNTLQTFPLSASGH